MNLFIRSLKTSSLLLLFFTLFLGIIYPYFMWGVGHIFFKETVNGSLIYRSDGKVLGSSLIGQNFEDPQYFHPRPSAAGKGFQGDSSSGSNLGPTSQKLIDLLQERALLFRAENNLSNEEIIPSDAVTASGSGLDPHISVENARLQLKRVAKARSLPEITLYQLINDHTEGRFLGFFGAERINVLKMNLALDRIDSELD
jgi:K+-transporting ATPase ATPase C chain